MKRKNEKEIEAIYPLTYLQEGILYHSIYNSDPELYFEQFSCRISGSFNIAAFRAAWQEVINRHAVLRTSFAWKNTEQMMQVVFKTVTLPCSLLDWANYSEIEQDEQLQTLLNEDRKTGFNLNAVPLMRITIIKLSDDKFQFIWSHHHIIIDAWSQSILLKELFQFYKGFCNSECIQMEMPRPFRDFVMWLRSKENNNEEFWKKYLKGFTGPTLLPFESGTPAAVGTGKYEHQFSSLSAELTTSLTEFGHSLGITVSTILQCVWAILLRMNNDEADVLFGVTTAGRPPEFEKIESVIGLFINTIPVRVQFIKDETVREFLLRIQSGLLEVREYEYSSLVQIHGYSEVPGEIPLFRSIVVYENVPVGIKLTEQSGALKVSDIKASSKTNYPLVLVAIPGEKISIGFAYDTNIFSADTIKVILGHLLSILNSVIAAPEQKLSKLSVLSVEEQNKIVTEWNSRFQDNLIIRLLHEMFEAQVDLTPENPAVTFEGSTLTFEELNEESNRLANYLIEKGIRAEEFVGLYVNRSLEMIIGIMGILKSGGAYVPIDPDYPEERVKFILQDAQVKYLITKEEFQGKTVLYPGTTICFDKDKNIISAFGNKNPHVKLAPENAAYVIYTSGSTGIPKGVVVTHLGTCNLFESMKSGWGINSKSRIMQFASIGFDASIPEIFLSLTSGAELFIAPHETVVSAERTAEFITANRISLITFPPFLLSQLSTENLPPYLTVVSAGETCPWEIAHRWSESQKFLNAYGPTEVTVCCSWNEYGNDTNTDMSSTFPVGKPFQNVKIYILDRYLKPVPPGIPGEIYVSSPGLARGYLNRPDLTAGSFVPDPFSKEEGRRLYRTGDKAKYHSDGNIEIIGRNDYQVKLRGFRIELQEIESVLTRYDGILNAVVLAKKNKSGERYLAAYLTPSNETHDSNMAIRKYLSTKLPDYMIPVEYNFVERFPLSANGKLDRKALLKIPVEKTQNEEKRKPLTQLEGVLKVIWEEVLELPDADIQSNFFELGGHSLKATKVLSRIRKVIGVNVSLGELYNNPTIYLLSKVIQKKMDAGTKNILEGPIEKSIKRNDGVTTFETSFSQQRLWFLEQLSPENSMFNVPLSLRLNGELNYEALKSALAEIVKRHESLRTIFVSIEGNPYQVIKDLEIVTLDCMDLSSMETDEAKLELERIASSEIQKKILVSEGPLFRFKLVKLSQSEHILLIIMHHIISDGWSMTVFIQELIQLYNSFAENQMPKLPELPIQYVDFAEWQRKRFVEEEFNDQLEYWKGALKGIKPLLELPADCPRPPVQTFNGAVEKFVLDKNTENKIRLVCRKESVTQFTLLLSVFQILLARLSNCNDVVVGTPVANRTNVETEKLIGFFVNTLAMRYTFQGNSDFKEMLKVNREKLLKAFMHQDLPFEKLVEKLQPGRDLSYAPIFQVAFVYQNYVSSKYELPGIVVSQYEVDSPLTKYDITLTISEEPDGELVAFWEYNTDLFKRKTILRMIEYFKNLLVNLLENQNQSIWEVAIISPEENDRLINQWNSNTVNFPDSSCIHELFEAMAEKYSGSIALTYSGLKGSDLATSGITYGELNSRSNQLANYLRKNGLEAENIVAISLPRSIEMIVAIWAVLKAGGAFIPLDTSYPKERLSYMLLDSNTKLLVTTDELAGKFPDFKKKIIAIDKEELFIQSEAPGNLENITIPDNLAYIIYTSGSTGHPKGAMLSHKGLCSLAAVQQLTFNITPESRILQFASCSFDAFVWELVMALLNGARLDLMEQVLAYSAEDISRIIHKTGTTIATFPPSILARLPETYGNEEYLLSSINTLIVAGEKCPVELANYWLERVKLYNGYGPTETTVCVSMHCCDEKYKHYVPIGRSIGNCKLYVLDRNMNPVPVGTPGELCIGGIGLSRGYINKPELTAEKFLPDPFSSTKGARLYKSGDMVKYNDNGLLEFIGRLDSQVKIHGLRIEPGEIEAVMLEHPDILEAAVKVHVNSSTEGMLIGYLTSRNGEVIPGDVMRKFLRNKLPEYMVPSLFITLPEFPLTGSGKTDYKALPSPDILQQQIERKYVEPGNEIEKKLAEISMQLLKIDRLGIYDNFFELGGHSLLVTRLISKIRDEFGLDIPLRTVFERPTISEMALIIQEKKTNAVTEKEKVEKASRGETSIVDLLNEINSLSESETQKLMGESE